MTDTNAIGRVRVERRIDDARALMVARGRFDAFFRGLADHSERWEIPHDGLTWTLMRQGLAAAALHLGFRPADETVGITINFLQPPVNIFLSGDASASTVTGRAFTEGVRTADRNRLFVQTWRTRLGPSESMIEVEGLDVLDVFEQYYRRSVQVPARFFEWEDDRFGLVMPLPDSDAAFLAALGRDEVDAWADGAARPLDEREFRFHCGCNPARMLETLRALFAKDPEDLFRGEASVEALCPRCGSRWDVTREQFAAAPTDPEAAGA